MKIKNEKLAGVRLNVRGQVYIGDSRGVFDLPEEDAKMILATPGWSGVQRVPRSVEPSQAAAKPEPAPAKGGASEDDETGGESEGDEGDEGDVPPYSEWTYDELRNEARRRMEEDENFVAPKSKKSDDIIEALEADDARAEDED